ncbi:hypothetical protein HDV64DRAFT_140897 [Trichoderma sp. TUCIM 5745]
MFFFLVLFKATRFYSAITTLFPPFFPFNPDHPPPPLPINFFVILKSPFYTPIATQKKTTQSRRGTGRRLGLYIFVDWIDPTMPVRRFFVRFFSLSMRVLILLFGLFACFPALACDTPYPCYMFYPSIDFANFVFCFAMTPFFFTFYGDTVLNAT